MLLHTPTKTYLHIVSSSEQHVMTEFKIGTGNGQTTKAVTRLVHIMVSLKDNITLVIFYQACSIQVNQATSGNLHKFEHFCAL